MFFHCFLFIYFLFINIWLIRKKCFLNFVFLFSSLLIYRVSDYLYLPIIYRTYNMKYKIYMFKMVKNQVRNAESSGRSRHHFQVMASSCDVKTCKRRVM